MSNYVPQAENLTWEEWASAFVGYNGVANIPLPLAETDWKTWADHIGLLPDFEGYNVPEAAPFERWQDWAEALSLALIGSP